MLALWPLFQSSDKTGSGLASAHRVQFVKGCWEEKTAWGWDCFWEDNWKQVGKQTGKEGKGKGTEGPSVASSDLPVWPPRRGKGPMTRGCGCDE